FFFSSRRRHTRSKRDWSSDVCSSDLVDTFCVCELVEFLNMSQPSISQHLKRLRDAQIVIEEKRGKWNYYTLNKMHPQYTVLLHLISVLPPIEMKFVKENRIECGS